MLYRLGVPLLLLCVPALGCSADQSGPDDGPDDGASSCASLAELDGRRYHGHGELRSSPATTGRSVRATSPACDDGNGEEPEPALTALELVDIPLSQGFLVGSTLYVRADQPLPEAVRAWFAQVSCTGTSTFTVTGPWEGVRSSREVRFDGDIRPPYRVTMWVTQGPEEYVGARLTVHADDGTDPQLGPSDVKKTLWQGGDISASVHCDGGRFTADALRSAVGR